MILSERTAEQHSLPRWLDSKNSSQLALHWMGMFKQRPIIYLENGATWQLNPPSVGAQGPTRRKCVPAVAAFVIKLIVLPSHVALDIQAPGRRDGKMRTVNLNSCRT